MTALDNPAPMAGPTSAESPPQPDVSQLGNTVDRRELADLIRRRGDMLNDVDMLLPRLGVTGIAGAAMTGIVSSEALGYGSTEGRMVQGVVGMAAIATVSKLRRAGVSWRNRRAQEIIGGFDRLSEETGLTLELFDRRPKRKARYLELKWSTADDTIGLPDTVDSLHKLETVAAQAGAEQVSIPWHQVADFVEWDDSKVQSNGRWVDDNAGYAEIFDDDQASQRVLSLTPAELTELAKHMELAINSTPLDKIMSVLGEVKPNHPAVKHYAAGGLGTDKSKFDRILRRSIERRLDDVAAVRGTMDDPTRRKVHVKNEISLQRGEVVVREKLLPDLAIGDTRNLLAAKKLSKEALADALTQWKYLPAEQAVALAEIAALYLLRGEGLPLPEDFAPGTLRLQRSPQGRSPEQTRVPTVQKRVAQKLFGRTRAERRESHIRFTPYMSAMRKFVGGVSVALAFSAGSFASGAMDDAINDREPTEVGGALGALQDARSGVAQSAHAVVEALPGSIEDTTIDLGDILPDPPGNSVLEGVSPEMAESSNRPNYYLTAYGDASTTGYWAEARQTILRETENTNQRINDQASTPEPSELPTSPIEMFWDENLDREATPIDFHQKLMLPGDLDTSDSLIRVEFATPVANLQATEPFSFETKEESGVVILMPPVPVLSGSRIVAAQASPRLEENLYLAVFQDGSQRIEIPQDVFEQLTDEPGDEVVFEYWVAPGMGQYIQAIEDNRVYDPAEEASNNRLFDADVRVQWGLELGSGPAGNRDIKDYITNELEYEHSPAWSIDENDSVGSLTGATIEKGIGNCWSANTLAATVDPELNVVTGYFNRNTPEQQDANHMFLSNREAHLYGINGDGVIQDFTPVNGTEDDAAFFEENFEVRGIDRSKYENGGGESYLVKYLIAVAGVVALGGAAAAISQRRELAAMTKKLAAQGYLRLTPEYVLSQALDTAHHALYAGPDAPLLRYTGEVELDGRPTFLKPATRRTRLEAASGLHDLPRGKQALKSGNAKERSRFGAYSRDLRRARRGTWAAHNL